MNWLKKGPELKLSEIKVPDFLFDLYYDLKERHLLPLVAVLAIAIVVLPIALSRSAGSSEAEEEAETATPSSVEAEASSLAVARTAPGLRDYHRRLRAARALDPFRQQAEAAAAAVPSGESPSPAVEIPATVEAGPEASIPSYEAPVESSPPVSLPSEAGTGAPDVVTKTQTKYASQTLDVRIVSVPQKTDGAKSAAKAQAEVRRQLPELTMLPSREAPAAVFMGTSSDGKKALLLVSSDVQSVFGDGQCVVGSQTCQLLALEAGVPETFVYGPQGHTYRIEILALDETLSDKPQRAPLGEPKGGDGKTDNEQRAAAGRLSTAQPR